MNMNENPTVAIRLLPTPPEKDIKTCWEVPGPTSITDKNAHNLYIYDKVYTETSSADFIYEDLFEKYIWKVLEGYNACIISYGQNDSSKPAAMQESLNYDYTIYYLAIQTIFAYIHGSTSLEYLLKCSYYEICNECVNDLLHTENYNVPITYKGVICNKSRVKLPKSMQETCASLSQARSLISLGNANRTTGWKNVQSSIM